MLRQRETDGNIKVYMIEREMYRKKVRFWYHLNYVNPDI